MEQRNLGRSGLLVSVVGLGCNNFGGRIDFEATKKVVHKALDLGITFFDEADTYGDPRGSSEACLGQILGDRRKDIVLATKFARPMDAAGRFQGASRRYIMAEVEASLRRLKTDWIDLYQQHQPDPLTPIEETMRALDDLVRQGKVRYIGCSTLPAWQVVEAQWTSKHLGLHHFISCQEEYSLLARGLDREMMPMLEAYGLGLIPFRPLADGLLTGKYGAACRRPPAPVSRPWRERRIATLRMKTGRLSSGLRGLPPSAAIRYWSLPSVGCCAARRWPASSPARPSRNRSNRMCARRHGP